MEAGMANTNSKQERERLALLAGLAAGAVLGVAIGRRLPGRKPMPHLKTWQRLLAAQRGEVAAAVLAARIQAKYDRLYEARPRFEHPALRWHLEQQLLPGLALYRVMQEEYATREQVETEVSALFNAAFTEPHMQQIALLRHLPRPFRVLRLLGQAQLALEFPSSGWEMETIEDSDRAWAFNVYSCFYLDVLTAYGAPELTRLFCQLDDVIYGALPPGLAFERAGTLGRGDDRCDFRFCLEQANGRQQATMPPEA
ncbi:MAG: hypothetical protein Kow00124_24480 [Anaerolineae bacterium]